jgi:hypothetical protein
MLVDTKVAIADFIFSVCENWCFFLDQQFQNVFGFSVAQGVIDEFSILGAAYEVSVRKVAKVMGSGGHATLQQFREIADA